MSKRFFAVAIMFIVLSAAAPNVSAATVKWDGGGADLEWNTDANWDGNLKPTASDDVIIDDTYVISSQAITATTTSIVYNSLSISSAAYSHSLTLSVDASGGSVTIAAGGAINGGSRTITCSGNWDSSAGTFTYGTSTVDLTGTGNLKAAVNYWTKSFYNLSCAAATKTTTLLSHINVSNILTLGSGIISGSSYYIVLSKAGGTPFVNGGATINTGRVMYYTPASSSVTVTGGNYGSAAYLQFYPTGNNVTFSFGGGITIASGIVWAVAGSSVTGTVVDTQDYALAAYRVALGNSGSSGSITVNCGASSIDIGTNGLDMYNNGGSHALNLNSATVTCAGPWQLTDGTGAITQNGGTSTVTLDGTSQTITGSGSFYNLAKTVSSADTLTFDNTAAQTITHNLTLNGVAGQLLSLRSNSTGNQWSLTVDGAATYNLDYLDVKDSDASGGIALTATNSVNSLNNLNWNFGAAEDSFFLFFE